MRLGKSRIRIRSRRDALLKLRKRAYTIQHSAFAKENFTYSSNLPAVISAHNGWKGRSLVSKWSYCYCALRCQIDRPSRICISNVGFASESDALITEGDQTRKITKYSGNCNHASSCSNVSYHQGKIVSKEPKTSQQ